MNKLLIICGPTATGKTDIALQLIKLFPAQIISADSRQVYRDMDIGTGKDIPSKFRYQISDIRYQEKKIPFHGDGKTKIWGYDLVTPTDEFSIAHFYRFAWHIIRKLWKENTLPILVGGTGQYLECLLNPPTSINVRPNQELRQQLSSLTVRELQARLKKVDKKRWQTMNHSDQLNPRRLIRAIEVALQQQKPPHLHTIEYVSEAVNALWIGLKAPLPVIDKHISQRVAARTKSGMITEVEKLMRTYPSWEFPAFSSTGYQEWRNYLEGKITWEQAINLWQQRERQYARRQLTWFKKMPQISWYNIAKPNWQDQLVHRVKTWYST